MGLGSLIKGAWRGLSKAASFGLDRVLPALAGSGIIEGAASVGGQVLTNEANKAEAERNRVFQEHMSSTAVQRSVKDYEAAGLNPALAYDRSAVGGSGAQAVIGNPMEAGISSARNSRRLRQEMQQAAEQHTANVELTRSQAAKARVEGETALESARLMAAQRRGLDVSTGYALDANPYQLKKLVFESMLQPYQLRSASAAAQAAQYALPSLRNDAAWSGRLGIFRPALHDILGTAKGISPFLRR